MDTAFATDPAHATPIRPGTPALVVFRDRTELAWLRWLARGFRHCAVIVRLGGDWVLIDSLSHSLFVARFAAEPIDRLAARYRAAGMIAVETRVRAAPPRLAPILPFSCVEAVKRVLGIHAWTVLTPRQLHRHLTASSIR
ncbi:MAG: hypothetical protein ING19_12040 [Azospirillum sp.]|nr:hypothetical protein [Azospirillum sp.]MCA3266787.1 hypothetical protein [Azospirillum sp.]MCZ8125026.1 hypothetical protein [Magnetospirillum sp.]